MARWSRFFAALTLATALAAGAIPAEAAKIGGKGVASFVDATPQETFDAFAGHTVIMERPKDTRGYRRDRIIEVEGRFVAYFAPNGSLLVWSKDSDKVIAGGWGIGASQNLSDGPDKKSGPMLCISFKQQTGKQPCIVIRYMSECLLDAAEGNIFKLKAGAPVPGQLPRNPSKLDRIAKDL